MEVNWHLFRLGSGRKMVGTFDSKPRVCFEVEKIIGVSFDGNCQRYQVQWAPVWLSSFHLVGCEHLIQEFLQKQGEPVNEPKTGLKTCESDKISIHESVCCSSGSDPEFNSVQGSHLISHDSSSHRTVDTQLDNTELCHEDNDSIQSSDLIIHEEDADNVTITVKMEEVHEEPSDSIMMDTAYKEPDNNDLPQYTVHSKHANSSLPSKDFIKDNRTSLSWNRIHHNGNKSVAETAALVDIPIDVPLNESSSLPSYHTGRGHRDRTGVRRHTCTVCGKWFPSESKLATHFRTHTGDKPFECLTCGRKFSEKGNLKRHSEKVHLDLFK